MATVPKSKIYKYRVDRRDHAVRVLCAGLSGQARMDRMVELLSNPSEMWRKYSYRIGIYSTSAGR